MYSVTKNVVPKLVLTRVNNYPLRNIKKNGFESPITLKGAKKAYNPILKADGCRLYLKEKIRNVNYKTLCYCSHKGYYTMY